MKISVIVPIYNCEPYLEKCLNSLLNQTYKNLEIILIDDGSTDRSGSICDDFAKKDERFTVIHKDNEGVCVARNCGLEAATGDYIGFVDSDDYCSKNMFSCMADLVEEYRVDIACCGIKRIYLDTGATFFTKKIDGVMVYNQEEALEKFFLPDHITTAVWNKIFKAEIAKKVKFTNYARNDDGWFVGMSLLESNNMAVCDECLYIYQIRTKSITRGNFSNKNFDIINSIDDIYEKVSAKYPCNKNMIMCKIFWYVVFIDEMIIAGEKLKKEIYNTQRLIKGNYSVIAQYSGISNLRKCQFYLLAFNYYLYAATYYGYCKLWGKQK